MTETFFHAGLACEVIRTRMGHYCGYVNVPPDHPWFGLDYSDKVSVPQSVIDRDIGPNDLGIIPLFCAHDVTAEACSIDLAISVHGGITYANGNKDKGIWQFGFDCAHSGDGRHPGDAGWKDADYVKAECKRLADQLAKFGGAV